MKKVYVSGSFRQEILDRHVLDIQEYVEQAIKVFVTDFMGANDGIMSGLAPSITAGGQSATIAQGTLLQNGVYGELTASTAVIVSKPVSGTRTDLIVGSYEEVLTDYASGFILLDVSSRLEQIVTLPGSKTGQIKFEQLLNTDRTNAPANKIPICEITLNTSSITSLADVRAYTKIQKAVTVTSNFDKLFYGLM